MANLAGQSAIGAQTCFTGRVDSTPQTGIFPVATNVLRDPSTNAVIVLLVSDLINLSQIVGQTLTLCGTLETVSGLSILRVTGVLSAAPAVSPPVQPSGAQINQALAQLLAAIRANPALLQDPRVINILQQFGIRVPI